MENYIRLYNTLKYLKIKQIYFRLLYFIRAKLRKLINFKYSFFKESTPVSLKLKDSIENHCSIYEDNRFILLNLEKSFQNQIDWNYADYGKLWTYNLTYFEYLKKREDISLISDFIEHIEDIKDGLEPFPISLRGLNWIKFLIKFQIKDKRISDSLYAQYYILLDNLEYHLLGNHLLENGFSLLFGAYYFKDEILYDKAKEILEEELAQQILQDGGHFELSPMYHQLMLFRLLDSINLVQNNLWKKQELLELFIEKAEKMLGWLKIVSFQNGSIPLFNDSTNCIAPRSEELFLYAKRLGLKTKNIVLGDSGYRKIYNNNYECIVDVGEIGSDFIPGHAHADTFNFELYVRDMPIIVDTGVSTYNQSTQRERERSTLSHNTVLVNDTNQTEVWAGFRVARRANIILLEEYKNYIKAQHNGYEHHYCLLHQREFLFKEKQVQIIDTIIAEENKKIENIKALFHFHPRIVDVKVTQKGVELENICIEFEGVSDIKLKKYLYAYEFNSQDSAFYIEVDFNENLISNIYIKETKDENY